MRAAAGRPVRIAKRSASSPAQKQKPRRGGVGGAFATGALEGSTVWFPTARQCLCFFKMDRRWAKPQAWPIISIRRIIQSVISINPNISPLILTTGRTAHHGSIEGIWGAHQSGNPALGGSGVSIGKRGLGDQLASWVRRASGPKGSSRRSKTARSPKTAAPLSGVCSPGGAAVELDGNVPVPVGLRPHEKVQWL